MKKGLLLWDYYDRKFLALLNIIAMILALFFLWEGIKANSFLSVIVFTFIFSGNLVSLFYITGKKPWWKTKKIKNYWPLVITGFLYVGFYYAVLLFICYSVNFQYRFCDEWIIFLISIPIILLIILTYEKIRKKRKR